MKTSFPFRPQLPRRIAARGFSLIELMVAVVVLSLGLLGMAALMATSLRNAQSANFRTQATNLAYDMIDVMRADRRRDSFARINNQLNDYTDPGVCDDPKAPLNYGDCTGADGARNAYACDIARWERDLCYALPGGRGRVEITPVPSTRYAYTAQVDVCWTDERTLVDADDADEEAECPEPAPACSLASPAVAECSANGLCTFSLCAGL